MIFAPGLARNMEQKLEAMLPEERRAFLDTHPKIRERFEEGRLMMARYAEMSPAERQQFLQTHAGLQRFIQNHPQAISRAEADAREARPGVVDPGHPRVNEVNQREENQQQRIAQGVAAGTLSSSQAAKIEGQEAKIQAQEAKDMNGDHGHLTQAEQNQLNREENHVSAEINDDKHGLATTDPGHPHGIDATQRAEADAREARPGVVDPGHPRVNEVNQREENQQQRIAQGVAAGTLSSSQNAKIEGQEAKIQAQEAKDMNGDHGHLTQAEQNKLNREENHVSTEIYDDKHGLAKPSIDPGHPRVNEVTQRQDNQQGRIGEGVASGKLTAGQAAGLEKAENKIQKEKVADMAGDHGHLTKPEQRQINKQQNHVSHRIAQAKHAPKK